MSVPCTNTSGTAGCVAECPLSEWVQAGHDRGTTVRPLPSDEAVFAAARALLGMKIDDDDATPLLHSRHAAARPLLAPSSSSHSSSSLLMPSFGCVSACSL